MRLHICGARGSTPAPGQSFVRHGGHTSCVALAHDGADVSLLLDAGTGIRNVSALLGGHPFVGAILLGHLHWDHTQGLPFFRAGDRPDAQVELYLPAQDGDAEATLARGFSPPHFPIAPGGLRGQWRFHGLTEGKHRIADFDVLAREIPHKGGRTFGYRISDGTATIAYLSDHHPASLGPGPDGYGPYHDTARELADDADVLLHDAQYVAAEWDERQAFGHSTVDYAVGLAEAAGVGRLVLFHHDPARTDDEMVVLTHRARADATVDVVAAAEGDELVLPTGDG
ncbi:MAG: MBL fold metallo-hydrolase [Actinobacteria bacterium]|nr:MBL fold metallo-hydrolase [Actinomycetota bacterium]